MLGALELGALGFAAYRATQLIVHDSILDGLRQRLEMWHARQFDSRVRSFVRDLISCIYCVSFHMAWLAVLAYMLAVGTNPVGSVSSFWLFGIQSFAVAGLAALLGRYDDTLPVR